MHVSKWPVDDSFGNCLWCYKKMRNVSTKLELPNNIKRAQRNVPMDLLYQDRLSAQWKTLFHQGSRQRLTICMLQSACLRCRTIPTIH